MKKDFKNSIYLGGILFFFFGIVGGLGINVNSDLISLDLDKVIALGSLVGILCSYIAYKKDRNPSSAFWVGLIFGPLGILYYLISKPGMSDKEKELHEWETEKKYQEMIKEKSRQ